MFIELAHLKMCSNKNNDLFKLSIFRSTRSLLVNWAMKVWNRKISGVQTVSNRPFRNSTGNWGEFQILTNR